MMIRKRRESKQSVIVVLEGINVSTEKTGIAPLSKATRDVANPEDEILVLTLLHWNSFSDDGDYHRNQVSEGDCYINSLHKEISQRKEVYLQIFRPFYDRCKRNGVKFQVKVAAGFRPKDIIVEEANNAKATWIIIDSCFARDLSFRLCGTECIVSLVGEDEEGMVHNHLQSNDASESSFVIEEIRNPKSPKQIKVSISLEEERVFASFPGLQPNPKSLLPSTSAENDKETIYESYEESENLSKVEPAAPTKETVLHNNNNIYPQKNSEANVMLGLPLELSWEVILEITSGFSTKACSGEHNNSMAYAGYLSEYKNFVLVKRYAADSSRILEAEKRAALSLSHKNILGLIGYHQSENATVLVFPFFNFFKGGSLGQYVCGLKRKHLKLKFQEKMKIAIGIAQGIRYMHEDCPQGPVVHGDLQISNILLRHDLQPLIFGFAQVTWLRLGQASPVTNKMCCIKDGLDHEAMALVQSDVYSFGVLLLRMFCGNLAPEDDRSLIKWARPLMLKRKFHKLLEEDSDKPDMIGIYRVMTAATECTKTKPITRPRMSKVISILKGEDFCVMQSSPSDSSL